MKGNSPELRDKPDESHRKVNTPLLHLRKIAVIGMGYVGIPAAALFAEAGFDVTGIQRRSKRSGWKIDLLNKGISPIGGNEPDLPEILHKVVGEKRFRVSEDYSIVKEMDVVLIDVQTPTDHDHVPQYESLKEVCHQIGPYLLPGKLIVIESTVAPGTTEQFVKPILEKRSGLSAGLPDGFGLCFSYERVMVGRLIHNIREYPKIVGGIDKESTEKGIELYKSIVRGGVHGTDPMTAEISKTVENAYRDVQIAFANEVALLCESLGVDVYDVRKFVNGLPNDSSSPFTNPYRNMHFPGGGVGGHCLPKDTWLLMYGYNNYGYSQEQYPDSVMAGARKINDWMPVHMVELLESALHAANIRPEDSLICVLGYAFLENSDDDRNSPSLTLIEELNKRRIPFKIHDPYIKQSEGNPLENDLDSAISGCDAIVLMTKHDQYQALSPEKAASLMKTRILVDGRNLYDLGRFSSHGFIVKGIGKGNYNKRKELI